MIPGLTPAHEKSSAPRTFTSIRNPTVFHLPPCLPPAENDNRPGCIVMGRRLNRFPGVRMDKRFTLKDFCYITALVIVAGAVLLAMLQFNYQEQQLIKVKDELVNFNTVQTQQLAVLQQIKTSISRGGTLTPESTGTSTTNPSGNGASTAGDNSGIIRRHNPDGSYYVYFPHVPIDAHDPRNDPNYTAGDWMVDNLGDEPAIITPMLEGTASEADVQGAALESLITRDRITFEWQPYLAESYEQMADKLTIRFVLRKNITFSDGTPMTVDDVLFTYKTARDPRINDDRYKATLDRLDTVTKVDDRTIDFKFKMPYFDAISAAGGLGIIPEHVYHWTNPDDFNNRKAVLVGSGAYMLNPDNWIRGQRIILTRNPNYWGERPTFDRIVYLFVMNPQASFQLFQNQEIDTYTPQPDQYRKFTADPEFQKKFKYFTYQVPTAGYRYIGWNMAKPMFKDKLTRQALTELINRDAIISTIQKGFGIPITGPFSPLTNQSDKTIQPWPYDPEDAKKKLAAAGWALNSDGLLARDGHAFEFELDIPSEAPVYEQSAVYIKKQLGQVGIKMTITPYEFSVLGERLDQRTVDAAMLGWTAGIEDDPTQIFASKSISGKGSNWVAYSNPEVDKLIEQAVQELDESKRMTLWHQIHRIIHEDQPYTFLLGAVSRSFVNKRFENTDPDKSGLNSGVWYVPLAHQKYH
jgi:peptide/nickel transport system substrate-binding protein